MQIAGMTIHAGVDGFTLVVAATVVPFRILFRWARGSEIIASTRKCAADFLNGTTIVPFLLMMGAVASRDIFDLLTQTNMAFIGIAGFIGFLFVLGELIDTKA